MSTVEFILKIRNTLNFSKHFLDLKGNDGASSSPLTKQKLCWQSPIHISFWWASHLPSAENVVGQGLAAAPHPGNGPQQPPRGPFPPEIPGRQGPTVLLVCKGDKKPDFCPPDEAGKVV